MRNLTKDEIRMVVGAGHARFRPKRAEIPHQGYIIGSTILSLLYCRNSAARAYGSTLIFSRSPCTCGKASSRLSMKRNQSVGTYASRYAPKYPLGNIGRSS